MKVDIKGIDLTKDVKGKLKVFDFPSMPVSVSLEVPIPDKKLDVLLQQKLTDAGNSKIDEIQDLFTKEMTKIDSRLSAALAKDPKSVNLKAEQATADAMSKQIANMLPVHVKIACEKVYADIQKGHAELRKYQLKCAVKIGWASLKLSIAAARLGASHGADVTAWLSAGKEIYAIGAVIYELAKSADTVQKEVGKEYKKLIEAVAKVKKETKNIKVALRQIGDVEPKCKAVEGKLDVLRPKVQAADEKSHALSKSLDKLLNAARGSKKDLNAPALKKEQVMEAKINGLIQKIVGMQEKVQSMTKYAAAIDITIAAFRADYTKGTATTVEVVGFLQQAKALYDGAKEVVDVVKDIVDLAA